MPLGPPSTSCRARSTCWSCARSARAPSTAGGSPSASSRSRRTCCASTRARSIPSLHRLEHEGWIEAEWGSSENNRRAKFYRLTRAGQKRLGEETASWERLSAAVARVLRMA